MRRVSHHGAAARRLALRLHPSRAAVCATLRMRRAAGVYRASVAQTSLEYQTAKAPPALLFGRRGRALGSRSVALFVLHIACMRYARARGTPGSQPARGPVCESEEAHEQIHHGPPDVPAFRARCEGLAPGRPLVETGFLSTTGARTVSGREPSAWASAARAYVLRPAAATASRSASHDADQTPLDGAG
ncbi:MAG: hypothetical protein GHHEDOFH_03538 [Pseudorhodoplanes sp.]|nr:hypothetical protein [Pseudorhodoplanes sp.]